MSKKLYRSMQEMESDESVQLDNIWMGVIGPDGKPVSPVRMEDE